MAENHNYNSTKGYKWKYLGKRKPEYFVEGSFSRNRNPMASRKFAERQTYQGRDYAGIAGEFLPEQKILLRYNENDLFDMNFIEKLTNQIEELEYEIDKADYDTLEFGKEVIEYALIKYTPIDTGNLVSHWKVDIDEENGRILINNDVEYASNQEYGMYGDQNDKGQSLWYPGYYMMTKALHEGSIAMLEYQKLKQQEIAKEVERNND